MNAKIQQVSQAELDKVLQPDFNYSEFVFGTNKDNTPRHWKLKPLRWHYEKEFRKYVMPMLSVAYKPFETAMTLMSASYISDSSPSILKSIAEAETGVDDYLVSAVHVVLIAQDKDITKEWVEHEAESREQLMDIVEEYVKIHSIMDRLGNSLAERLVRIAKMTGTDLSLDSLKQLWKQLSEVLSAKITEVSSTALNVFGQFTGTGKETGYQTSSQTDRQPEEKDPQWDELIGKPLKSKIQ